MSMFSGLHGGRNLFTAAICTAAVALMIGFAAAGGLGLWLIPTAGVLSVAGLVLLASEPVVETLVVATIGSWFLPSFSVNLGLKAPNQVELGLLVVGLPFLVRCLLRGQFRARSNLSGLLLLYGLVYLQAILRAPMPSFTRGSMDGSSEIYQFCMAVICYLVTVNFLLSDKRLLRLISGVLPATVIGVMASFALFLLAPPDNALVTFTGLGYANYAYAGYGSVVFSSPFHIDNGYPTEAGLMGLTLLLAFGERIAGRPRARMFTLALFLAFVLGSRAAVASLALTLGAYALAARRVKRVWMIVMGLLVAGLLIHVSGVQLPAQVSRSLDFSLSGGSAASQSILRRGSMSAAIWDSARDSPVQLLIGSGIGSFLRVVGSRVGCYSAEQCLNMGYTGSHSLFLDALLVTGLVGLATVFGLFFVGASGAWKLFRLSEAPVLSRAGLWLFLVLFYTSINGLTGGSLNNLHATLYVSLVSAVTALTPRVEAKARAGGAEP